MQNTWHVTGLMSGTSVDGIDAACCAFSFENNKWDYKIIAAETFPFNKEWKNRLSQLHMASAGEFAMANAEFGILSGEVTKSFHQKYKLTPFLISSHGHTIFHQPARKMTFQVGSGAYIAAIAGIETVCDFRTTDVALGGQGAPLVPIGDKLLFCEYDFCLNLGGIANISTDYDNKRVAFDICAVNMALNYLASLKNHEFDAGGKIAAAGQIHESLLKELNELDFYQLKIPGPKSLGKEWFEKNFLSLINDETISVEDRLRTACEHIAIQIELTIKNLARERSTKKMIVTGGGAYNTFLIDLLKKKTGVEIIIPEGKIIEFKEALIFAFLGLLRKNNEVNALSSVTGATKDNIGGCIYLP